MSNIVKFPNISERPIVDLERYMEDSEYAARFAAATPQYSVKEFDLTLQDLRFVSVAHRLCDVAQCLYMLGEIDMAQDVQVLGLRVLDVIDGGNDEA